jgi:hypothetical protein
MWVSERRERGAQGARTSERSERARLHAHRGRGAARQRRGYVRGEGEGHSFIHEAAAVERGQSARNSRGRQAAAAFSAAAEKKEKKKREKKAPWAQESVLAPSSLAGRHNAGRHNAFLRCTALRVVLAGHRLGWCRHRWEGIWAVAARAAARVARRAQATPSKSTYLSPMFSQLEVEQALCCFGVRVQGPCV